MREFILFAFCIVLFCFKDGIVMKMKKIAAVMTLGCLMFSAAAFAEEAQYGTAVLPKG